MFPQHTIRLRDAWFRYPKSEDWVLRGINLTIPVGSRIALVGQTGSGKSTIAHLFWACSKPRWVSWSSMEIP